MRTTIFLCGPESYCGAECSRVYLLKNININIYIFIQSGAESLTNIFCISIEIRWMETAFTARYNGCVWVVIRWCYQGPLLGYALYGVWSVGCVVWSVGCGVRGVRCGVWGVGCKTHIYIYVYVKHIHIYIIHIQLYTDDNYFVIQLNVKILLTLLTNYHCN